LISLTVPANFACASSLPNNFAGYYEKTAMKQAGSYYWDGSTWGTQPIAKLTLGENVYIAKIDGVSRFVEAGKSITLPPGTHTIIQEWVSMDKHTKFDLNDPWEIYLRPGRSYIITGRPEGRQVIFSIKEGE
jgi:hypothetical protein